MPVVTNIAGAVEVRSSSGSSRDIVSSQILHTGDLLVTGVNSLAVVHLADVGRVRLGPGTTTTAASTGSSLSFNLTSGSLCVESERPVIHIQAGALAISAAENGTIFDLVRGPAGTRLAVFQGQIATKLGGKDSGIVNSGEAFTSGKDGAPQTVPIQTLVSDFLALHCPDDAIIARALATPGSTPAAASGGGGGGGGIIGVLLGIAGLAAIAGGHGGGGGGGGPQPSPSIGPLPSPSPSVAPSPSPSPGALTLDKNSLSFSALGGANSQTVRADEANYSGPIDAVSDNPAVATVSPGSGAGPSQTFTVTPVGAGSAHITVTDNHSGSKVVNVTVTLSPGPLSASPSSLQFTALGSGHRQPFTASEANYSGLIGVVSDNPGVASVSPASGHGPSANFTVTPNAAGTAHIIVADDHGGSATVNVNVAPPGTLTANPGTLQFLNTGASSQSFTAAETNYSGPIFTAAPSCTSVASVTPATGSGPSQDFTVTPVGAGSCTIIVTDDHGGTQSVSVTVFGALVVAPLSLHFNGTATAKTFTANETAYGGQFNTSGCSGVVTITPGSGNGPSASFSVKPVAAGGCTITVTDDHGGSRDIAVSVTTGALSVNPGSLTFGSATAGSRPFTASETNFTGAFNVSGCGGIVNVTPNPGTGPSQQFTVAPVAEGQCTLTVGDGTNTANVAVTVFGTLNLTPPTLTFSGNSTPQNLTAQEDFYTGPLTVKDPTCAGIVSVSGGGNGPTQVYSVTPMGAGSCSVTVSDNHGGFDTSTITVSNGAINVTPGTLAFNSAGAAAQQVTASETNYPGIFNVSGCSGIVSVTPNPGNGPNQVFQVQPVAAGSCTLTIADDHGGSGSVGVTVSGPLVLTPTSLSFGDTGAGSAQPFALSENSYGGAFTVDASACAGIATISAGPFNGPNASVTVTPQAQGSCNITVSDDHGGSRLESITVGPFGAIAPSTTSLTFTDVGSGVTQPFSVSESGYSGTFTIDQSACAGIASVSPASGTSSTTFTVTSVGPGGPCNLSISDDHGSPPASVRVTVGPFGAVSPSPNTLNLGAGGANGSFNVSETGYTGTFTADASSCGSIVSVTQGPPGTFSVTPNSAGNCAITVNDDHGQSAKVTVFVTGGGLSVSPQSLQFASPPTGSQSFTATSAGAATLSITSGPNPAVATIDNTSGPGPSFTFNITAVGNGRTSVTVSDGLGGTAVVSIGVGMSPLAVKHHPVKVLTPPKSTPRESPTPRPTVPTPTGPRATPNSPPSGEPTLPVAWPGGHVPPPVRLPYGALTVGTLSLVFTNPFSPQTLVVLEPNYAGAFTAVSSNPNVATVGATVGRGPSAWFSITPHNAGSAIIHIVDDHGGIRDVFVSVRPPEIMKPPVRTPGKPGPPGQ
ncbi:MAG: hypothetical protein M3Z37_01355 [Candidatus Eremiobacteraeota bacterium]|nr:hypothetical protein [Candidatus Eremiobacteraeota bacterium]